MSVQQAIEEAIYAFCQQNVKLQGAGRTDAGVHARGQVAHIDLSKEWRTDVLRDGLTAKLRPHPVAVLAAEDVPGDFDARFSARTDPPCASTTRFTSARPMPLPRTGASLFLSFSDLSWGRS